MANALVAVIKTLCSLAIQPLHLGHEIGFWRVDEHVIMVIHQTICIAVPPVLVDVLSQDREKSIAIHRIEKGILLGIAPVRQMIQCPRKHQAPGACHRPPRSRLLSV
jgi:hypothetical protein